jgi:hypothetical protein
MCAIYYIAATSFGAIILPYSGSLHQCSFKTNSHKIGRNKRTYIVVSVVQNFTLEFCCLYDSTFTFIVTCFIALCSHLGGDIVWGVWRIGFWGRYFGVERDEITGEWRRLLNEDVYNLYSSPNISVGIKSRRMRWVGHVACKGDRRGT